ncbi:hypothetical protein BB558_006563, partial [Smittium angustum]
MSTKIQVPEVFDSSCNFDAEEWIERFELIGRLNGWSNEDQIQLLQLYLGKKELFWYKKNKSFFSSWETLKELFVEKYDKRELEMLSWNRILSLKQQDFNSIEDLELELENLFDKAKVGDEKVKWNCFLSCLNPKCKRKILESNVTNWKRAVNIIRDSEKLDMLLDMDKGFTLDNRDYEIKETKNKKPVTTEPPKPLTSEPMYEAIIQKFGEISINLISKMDEMVEKVYKSQTINAPRPTEYRGQYRSPQCFHCRKYGHKKYECPELRNTANISNNMNPNQLPSSGVNTIETVQIENNGKINTNKQSSLYLVDKRTREDNELEVIENNEPKKQRDLLWESDNSNLESLAKETHKVRKKLVPKIALDVEPYSLKKDLLEIQPNISFAQLIKASPPLRNELVDLCKKVEEKPVNHVASEDNKVNNCKVI